MPLSVGTRLGPYEILAPIGAGGMGEVYRALDTKLKRDVALKVLPNAFAGDAERMARFQREAEVLASLNHPNIATIHGVEDRALVMELVEGTAPKGPLSFDEAWKIASQIAAALEYAHERGIMHRDLKPANILITLEGGVKLLDFGLAKAFSNQREPIASQENSPTLTLGATEVGVILGTAAYMAPEQARGKVVDKRADIWSFGVVLYEMLTGERLFTGEDAAETLAAVIHKQPDLAKVPRQARRLLEECLQKDPKQRLRDIGDAKRLLGGEPAVELAAITAPSRSRVSSVLAATAAAFALASIALGYIAYRHVAEEPPRVAKLTVLPPEKGEFISGNAQPALSPDGRHIAFVANVDNKTGLWVRDLDSSAPRLLAGTEGGTFPFWSPDSRYLGFGAGGKLRKIDVTGGPALTICDAATIRGASWSKDDVIVFAPNNNAGLSRVPSAGGVPTPVTDLDKSRDENSHRYPWFLPDGRHFLYYARSADTEKTGAFVGDLESKTRKQVVPGDTQAMYVAPIGGKPGYLVFLRDRTLMAQPFDAGKIAATGEAVPIAEQVDHIVNNHSMVAISQNGVLAYTSGSSGGGNTQVTWFDRSGKEVGTVGAPGNLEWASLSPDGATVAYDRFDSQSGNRDLWLHDLSRGTPSRLTFVGNSQYPVWSPDGARVAFLGTRGGKVGLYVKSANGKGGEEGQDFPGRPADWSRDGRFVIGETQVNRIWVIPQFGDKKPFVYLNSEFAEREAKLSPDGRWLAYRSNESKRFEIYVVSFPMPEGKWQISTNGGGIPVWSRDGRELYFVSADNKMMAVEIKTTAGKFQASLPKPLFDVRLGPNNPNFDVSKDGRFLIPTATEQSANSPMTVVLNWQAALMK